MGRMTIAILAVLLLLTETTGCERNPAESSKKQFESYSFVIITDLHIGYGIPNYYPEYQTRSGSVWLDGLKGSPGENDSQAEILKAVVEKIIEQKNSYNIKFVVVLGDISDTAEKSEFLTARAILNRLNEVGIAYIPLIGNHDTWPYTQPEDNFSAGDRTRHATIAGYAAGDYLFEDVFWGAENSGNIQLIKNLFGNSWQKAGVPVDDFPEVNHSVYLQNYGFSYEGITFVALDLAPRIMGSGVFPPPWVGIAYPGGHYPKDPRGALSIDHEQTIEFSKEYTRNHYSVRKTAILFSHYPLGLTDMFKYVRQVPEDYTSVYNFAGHQHITEDSHQFFSWNNTLSFEILTEDIGEIECMPGKHTDNLIRVVQIKDGTIDYSVLLPKRVVVSPTPSPKPTAIPRATATPAMIPTLTPTPLPVSEIYPFEGKIAFVSDRDGNLEIYTMEAFSRNEINLTKHPANDYAPAWSPDGGQIAFVSDRSGKPEIYIINADGSNVRRITQEKNAGYPVWLPDGKGILYGFADITPGGYRSTNGFVRLVDTDGMNDRLLASHTGFVGGGPAISPDGKKIAYVFGTMGGAYLRIIDMNGKLLREFPRFFYGLSFNPIWSPDGKLIAFSEKSSGGGIYVVDLENGKVIKITEKGYDPWWSKDGKWLVYALGACGWDKGVLRQGQCDLKFVNIEGNVAKSGSGRTDRRWDSTWWIP